MNTGAERIPVHNAEMAVVCALLIQQNTWVEVAGWLTPQMFYSPELAFFYEAIQRQCERGEKPDIVTTSAELRRMDAERFERIGGIDFLREGLLHVRHAENLTAYGEEVKRMYILRCLNGLFTAQQSATVQPEGDSMQIIAQTEKALLDIRELQQKKSDSLMPVAEMAAQTIDFHRRRMENNNDEGRVLTGLKAFDLLTGGMHAGELFVCAGRPGDGKSAVAMQIALNVAKSGKSVCVLSLEMTGVQMMNRYFAGHAKVDAYHLRMSGITGSEMEQMNYLAEEWKKLPLYIDYTAANSAENIRAQVMLHKKRFGCDLVIVDYLHLMEGRMHKNELMEHVVGRNVRAMKRLSIEADCPVLLLSQMNRNSENRHDRMHLPQLSDLRDSGTIEQVADCVFFVYRPDRYGITEDEQTGESLVGVGKFIVPKNRNGSVGVARFRFNETFSLIS